MVSEYLQSDFETVAINDGKYELLRFWLLGSWMAKQQGLKFVLINLVSSEKEKDIESKFKRHIKEDTDRTFLRLTWESIYGFIHEAANPRKDLIRIFQEQDSRLQPRKKTSESLFCIISFSNLHYSAFHGYTWNLG